MTPARVASWVSVGDCVRSEARTSSSTALAKAEIQNLDLLFRRDSYIGWLQVAVDDAFLVRRFQTLSGLKSNP